MTSCLLYTLAQLGFNIPILDFGINVIMDTINFAGALMDKETPSGRNIIDGNSQKKIDIEF